MGKEESRRPASAVKSRKSKNNLSTNKNSRDKERRRCKEIKKKDKPVNNTDRNNKEKENNRGRDRSLERPDRRRMLPLLMEVNKLVKTVQRRKESDQLQDRL